MDSAKGWNSLSGGVGDIVVQRILAGGLPHRQTSSPRCGWRGHCRLHRWQLLLASPVAKPLPHSPFTATTTARAVVTGWDAVMTAARSRHLYRQRVEIESLVVN